MEEILILVLQAIFELLAQVFANIPFDWPSKRRTTPEPEVSGTNILMWLFAGGLMGGLTLLIFRHTLVPFPALRVFNVIAAPILAAYVAQAIARRRRDENPNIKPRYHFWFALWYTFGLVLIRFTYALR